MFYGFNFIVYATHNRRTQLTARVLLYLYLCFNRMVVLERMGTFFVRFVAKQPVIIALWWCILYISIRILVSLMTLRLQEQRTRTRTCPTTPHLVVPLHHHQDPLANGTSLIPLRKLPNGMRSTGNWKMYPLIVWRNYVLLLGFFLTVSWHHITNTATTTTNK